MVNYWDQTDNNGNITGNSWDEYNIDRKNSESWVRSLLENIIGWNPGQTRKQNQQISEMSDFGFIPSQDRDNNGIIDDKDYSYDDYLQYSKMKDAYASGSDDITKTTITDEIWRGVLDETLGKIASGERNSMDILEDLYADEYFRNQLFDENGNFNVQTSDNLLKTISGQAKDQLGTFGRYRNMDEQAQQDLLESIKNNPNMIETATGRTNSILNGSDYNPIHDSDTLGEIVNGLGYAGGIAASLIPAKAAISGGAKVASGIGKFAKNIPAKYKAAAKQDDEARALISKLEKLRSETPGLKTAKEAADAELSTVKTRAKKSAKSKADAAASALDANLSSQQNTVSSLQNQYLQGGAIPAVKSAKGLKTFNSMNGKASLEKELKRVGITEKDAYAANNTTKREAKKAAKGKTSSGKFGNVAKGVLKFGVAPASVLIGSAALSDYLND